MGGEREGNAVLKQRILRGIALMGWGLCLVAIAYPVVFLWMMVGVDEPGYRALEWLFNVETAAALCGLGGLGWLAHRMTARTLSRFRVDPERFGQLHANQNGGLIFEFALAFPFILALIFIFFQWVELMIADAMVHYAAFVACRVGVTWASMPDGNGGGATGNQASRFQIDADKANRMRLAAEAALNGAKILEAARTEGHMPAQVVLDNNTPTKNLMEDDPENGGGAYRSVVCRVTWGFFPRWPLAQIWFKGLANAAGRIIIQRHYWMQSEGYYRTHSLRDRGPYRDRENLAKCSMYTQVLEENHSPADQQRGTRDAWTRGRCPASPQQGDDVVNCQQ